MQSSGTAGHSLSLRDGGAGLYRHPRRGRLDPRRCRATARVLGRGAPGPADAGGDGDRRLLPGHRRRGVAALDLRGDRGRGDGRHPDHRRDGARRVVGVHAASTRHCQPWTRPVSSPVWRRSPPGRGQEAIDLYRTERQARGEDVSPPALWIAMMTDHDFFVPAMRFAALQSDQAPSYAYLFTWPSPVMGGVFGSIHGLDLPFMWGLRQRSRTGVAGRRPRGGAAALAHDPGCACWRSRGRRPVDECSRLAGLRSRAASDHDLRSYEHDRGRTTGGRAPVLGARASG